MRWYNFPNMRTETSTTLKTTTDTSNFWNIKICPISKIILVFSVGYRESSVSSRKE